MRKRLWIALQTALGIAVAYGVGTSLARNWDRLQATGVDLSLRPLPMALAAAVVLATYALLIESWRRVLAGWDQRLPFPVATRIWAVSNLGRYLPGKVWSVAGLAVLAQQAGVAPWAAAGSAVILQALAVGTAAALVAATAPAAASVLSLSVAFACAAVTVAAVSWPPLARRLLRMAPRLAGAETPPVRKGPIALGTAATLGAWIAYGVALKLWAAGTLAGGGGELGWATAIGAFTASYVIGLLAIFAPGGLVVREGVMFTLLEGQLGPAQALALAVGSRLLLTATEIAVAGVGLAWRAGRVHAQRRD